MPSPSSPGLPGSQQVFRLLCVLAATLFALSANAEGRLDRAIELYQSGDEAAAAKLFKQQVASEPDLPTTAPAHIYLGLIALDSLKSTEAAVHFRRAIQLEPTVELPYLASPKAEILFNDVRHKILERGTSASGQGATDRRTGASPLQTKAAVPLVAAPGPATTPAPAAPEATTLESSSKLPSVAVLGAGAAALAAGVVFGVLSNNDARASQASSGQYTTLASLSRRAGTEGTTADILFACAGAAGIAGGILLGLELTDHGSTNAGMVVTPLGAAASVGGRF